MVVPVEAPRVAVAADGTLAAIHEPSRVTIVELPGGVAFAEIGVDPDALASEVAWVGAPPRILVSSRYVAHTTVHLLDPQGPRTIAEIRLEAPMQLFTSVGSTALVIGPASAAVLSAGESHLTWSQVPARSVPVTAGAAGGQFVVALTGSIEEWDPQSRLPKRRLRLPRAAVITAVGGSDRIVWMTTQQEPARIDVIPIINRGQPRAHDLPEPIAHITGHPRSDLVACVGARSGGLYVIDLDGKRPVRRIRPDGVPRIESVALAIGRMVGVVAAQAGQPIAILSLDGREPGAGSGPDLVPPPSDPAIRSPLSEALAVPEAAAPEAAAPEAAMPEAAVPEAAAPEAAAPEAAAPDALATPDAPALEAPVAPDPDERRSAAPAREPPPRVDLLEPSSSPVWSPNATSAPVPAPATARPTSSVATAVSRLRQATNQAASRPAAVADARPAPSAGERFSAWRDLVRQDQPRGEPSVPAPIPAGPSPRSDARSSWRDEVVAWSRIITSGGIDYNAPAAPAIDAVLARFELAHQLRPVLVLLYGAHLCGEPGAAPVDVARLQDRRWDDALGRGELALRGVACYGRSRVALARGILRFLDELAPATGTLVGEPGPVALLGPCVVVAGDEPLAAIAAQYGPRAGGAILAAHGEPDRAELFLEARAFGAVPMLRASVSIDPVSREPAIFVAGDPELADQLGLPRLA